MSVLSEIGRIQAIKDKLVLSLQRLGYNIDNKLLINDFAKIIDPFTNGESLSYLEKDQNYLTFKWVQNGAFYWKTSDASWTKDIQYKKNGTGEWITITSSTSGYVCDCITGDEIWVKGNNTTYASANYYCSFKIIGKTYISGNVNSLLNFNTILTDYCFRYLFYNCSFIDIDKEHPLLLPATTLADYCYSIMFRGCTSLTTTPALPATALVSGCYCQMFYGCTSLTTVPELPATTLVSYCYENMFSGCTSLNYIKCLATDISAAYCTSNWVYNVAASGTFVLDSNMINNWTIGNDGIHKGWTIYFNNEATLYLNKANVTIIKDYNDNSYNSYELPTLYNPDNLPITYSSSDSSIISINSSTGQITLNDYGIVTISISFLGNNKYQAKTLTYAITYKQGFNNSYLTFEAVEDTTFTFSTNALQYSLDNGSTWTTLAKNTASPTITTGNKIMWKQTGLTPVNYEGIGTFSATGDFKAYGNIMSLHYGDNFIGQKSLSGKNMAFYKLFYDNKHITSAKDLVLPAITLADSCYEYMFFSCTSLTTAPELPATTLATSCYYYMFRNCTSLTTAPVLPATILAESCYGQMFYNCTSLVTAPALPATTLAEDCYGEMFYGCTSLVTAPELPATTLAHNCYYQMFKGCTNLSYIKCLATNIYTDHDTLNWVYNVSSTGTFVKANSTSWTTGDFGIPKGWVVYSNNEAKLYLNKLEVIIYKNYIDNYELPTLYNPENLPVTYSSSDQSIISINSSTGQITLNDYGTVTISINFAGNNKYQAKMLTYIITYYEEIPNIYLEQYLTFEAIESGTFTLEIGSGIGTSLLTSVSYSTNNGSTWTTVNNEDNKTITITTPNIPQGNSVLWKGIGTAMSTVTNETAASSRPASCSRFTSTGKFNVFGNIMSLLYEDNFIYKTMLIGSSNFALLFYCYNMNTISNIVSAENLILPSADSSYAYFRMFQSNNIITPPSSLPATTLAYMCYYSMFMNCTSLTTAPELPATTLVSNCYQQMFYGCTSLITAPALPATTLAKSCYIFMFSSCTSLTTAPALPATTLTFSCYSSMFSGCTSLNYIKCLATNISASNCTLSWVQKVASSGTFVKAASMTSWTTGVNGRPSGWTVQNAS